MPSKFVYDLWFHGVFTKKLNFHYKVISAKNIILILNV